MKFLLVYIFACTAFSFASVGTVKTVKGKVELKRNKKVIEIDVGTTLNIGDIIQSKAKSSVGIIFSDGSRLSLGEKTLFVINEFKVKPKKKEYDVDLELKKGKALFSSGKIGKLAPKSVKFRIPKGLIGIRGTKFAVEAK
jgi:hypothetical protein